MLLLSTAHGPSMGSENTILGGANIIKKIKLEISKIEVLTSLPSHQLDAELHSINRFLLKNGVNYFNSIKLQA